MTRARQTGDVIPNLDAITEGNLVSVDADGNPVDYGNLKMLGLAPFAKVVFAGADGSITSSDNVSSVVRNDIGSYDVYFTESTPDTFYLPLFSVGAGAHTVVRYGVAQKLVDRLRVQTVNMNNNPNDPTEVSVAIFLMP